MKTITIVTEQVTERELTAAIPTRGVASVRISPNRSQPRAASPHRAFRNPARFDPKFRIEVTVDDDAVETVVDGVSFAYGAGFFGDAELWVNDSVLALSA